MSALQINLVLMLCGAGGTQQVRQRQRSRKVVVSGAVQEPTALIAGANPIAVGLESLSIRAPLYPLSSLSGGIEEDKQDLTPPSTQVGRGVPQAYPVVT
eukprot:g22643.t1